MESSKGLQSTLLLFTHIGLFFMTLSFTDAVIPSRREAPLIVLMLLVEAAAGVLVARLAKHEQQIRFRYVAPVILTALLVMMLIAGCAQNRNGPIDAVNWSLMYTLMAPFRVLFFQVDSFASIISAFMSALSYCIGLWAGERIFRTVRKTRLRAIVMILLMMGILIVWDVWRYQLHLKTMTI